MEKICFTRFNQREVFSVGMCLTDTIQFFIYFHPFLIFRSIVCVLECVIKGEEESFIKAQSPESIQNSSSSARTRAL